MNNIEAKLKSGCYSHIIFDWDGTLVDSSSNIHESIIWVFQSVFGITRSSVENDIIFHLGNGCGIKEVIARVAPHANENLVGEAVYEFIQQYIDKCHSHEIIFPNVAVVLERLKAKKMRLFICTNKLAETFKASFECSNLSWAFDKVYYGEQYGYKPLPAMGNAIVEEHLIENASSVLMIGDTKTDRTFAQNCGFDYLNFDHISSSPTILLKLL